jgi:hypothetical protein
MDDRLEPRKRRTDILLDYQYNIRQAAAECIRQLALSRGSVRIGASLKYVTKAEVGRMRKIAHSEAAEVTEWHTHWRDREATPCMLSLQDLIEYEGDVRVSYVQGTGRLPVSEESP